MKSYILCKFPYFICPLKLSHNILFVFVLMNMKLTQYFFYRFASSFHLLYYFVRYYTMEQLEE